MEGQLCADGVPDVPEKPLQSRSGSAAPQVAEGAGLSYCCSRGTGLGVTNLQGQLSYTNTSPWLSLHFRRCSLLLKQGVQLFPVCLVHVKPAPTNGSPGQCPRLGRAAAPISALTPWVDPGWKLLSVTVLVLEKPRYQRGRQNVLTLKISPTYSTAQLHQAPKLSLCNVCCCGKCWQG